jgi:hypothetical protein
MREGGEGGVGDASDAAALTSSFLGSLSFYLADWHAEQGCGKHTGHPECNCCVMALKYTIYGDDDLFDIYGGSGHLVKQPCSKVELAPNAPDDTETDMSPDGTIQITYKYQPW